MAASWRGHCPTRKHRQKSIGPRQKRIFHIAATGADIRSPWRGRVLPAVHSTDLFCIASQTDLFCSSGKNTNTYTARTATTATITATTATTATATTSATTTTTTTTTTMSRWPSEFQTRRSICIGLGLIKSSPDPFLPKTRFFFGDTETKKLRKGPLS